MSTKDFWMREVEGTRKPSSLLEFAETPHAFSSTGIILQAECPSCGCRAQMSLECLPITCSNCDTESWQPMTSEDIPKLFQGDDEEIPQ